MCSARASMGVWNAINRTSSPTKKETFCHVLTGWLGQSHRDSPVRYQ